MKPIELTTLSDAELSAALKSCRSLLVEVSAAGDGRGVRFTRGWRDRLEREINLRSALRLLGGDDDEASN